MQLLMVTSLIHLSSENENGDGVIKSEIDHRMMVCLYFLVHLNINDTLHHHKSSGDTSGDPTWVPDCIRSNDLSLVSI